ncbi:lytic exoenzyme target recognition domain-containing protein [Enterococcus gallinarum]|nr:hypothetical protein RV03_GL002202 [Enterococcus gallinarum]
MNMKNFRKSLLFVAGLFVVTFGGLFFSEDASATTTSQATSWVNSSIGKSYDFDGVYGAQCFDYINKYAYDLFGTSFSGAGAIDLLNTGNKNGFKVIRDGANLYPQTGDIFIYQVYGSPWGHTGIVINADKTGMTVADQNFNNVQRVQKHYIKYNDSWGVIKGWIRPPFNNQTNPNPTPNQRLKVYKVDDLQHINGLWQIKSNDLVPTGFNWTDNGIAVGDVIEVDRNGNKTSDQVIEKGSYFVFDSAKVISATNAQKGTGGWFWSNVHLKDSGSIWLSVWNKNDLLYGKK